MPGIVDARVSEANGPTRLAWPYPKLQPPRFACFGASANTKPPVLLTDTGCVDAVAPLLPATGGLPYSVQAQLGA